jgi:hypothetical protein
MAKARKRRAARRTKKTAKRGKRKTKAAKKMAKRVVRKTGRKKSAGKRKRTTAEGMHRALKMKQAAEEREREEHPQPLRNSPTQIPQATAPDPVPNNPREQGDTANIIQNTSNRHSG